MGTERGEGIPDEVATLMSSGDYARAVEVLRDLVEARKLSVLEAGPVADQLIEAGRNQLAATLLGDLADFTARLGFTAKAMAFVRKAVKADPTRRDLAELTMESLGARVGKGVKPLDTTVTGRLSLRQLGGEGPLSCMACGWTDRIMVFVHGHFGEPSGVLEMQCLACGRFQGVSLADAENPGLCRCGGSLSRDHTLFCPSCRGTELRYHMEVIT